MNSRTEEQANITEQDALAYLKLLKPENFPTYCETLLNIQSKWEGLIPLVLNPSQMRMYKSVEKRRKQGKPVRLIILKARQQGFSTMTEALCYKDTSSTHDFRSAIIAHDGFASGKLYKMFRVFYETFNAPAFRPERKSSGNAKEMVFNLLRSEINVLTAENVLGSSGATFQFIHVAELSKWRDAEEAMLSLLQTVSPTGTVIVESTAYGIGNYFYRMWNEAVKGRIDFEPLFFPWFEHPDYQLPLYSGEVIEPEGEERYYVERFGSHVITAERLKWLRYALKNLCEGSWDKFRQEYPAYPEEAFLSSGRPVFDVKMLQARELQLRANPPKVECGEFVLEEKNKDEKPVFKVDWHPYSDGSVKIYEHPEIQGALAQKRWAYQYVISADIAEGLDASVYGTDKSIDPDYNAVGVFNRLTQKFVAHAHNRNDPDQVAVLLFCLMNYYGVGIDNGLMPYMMVERNGPGLATIIYLRDLLKKYNIPLSRMYHRGPMDVNFEPSTDLLGFRTSGGAGGTKDPLIGEMMRRIREGDDGIVDLNVIEEAKVFIRDDRGRMGGQTGKHDDLVIMTALCYEGARRDHPPYEFFKKEKKTGWRLKLQEGAGGFTNPGRIGYWSGFRKFAGHN